MTPDKLEGTFVLTLWVDDQPYGSQTIVLTEGINKGTVTFPPATTTLTINSATLHRQGELHKLHLNRVHHLGPGDILSFSKESIRAYVDRNDFPPTPPTLTAWDRIQKDDE